MMPPGFGSSASAELVSVSSELTSASAAVVSVTIPTVVLFELLPYNLQMKKNKVIAATRANKAGILPLFCI